jgi:hypothetical protein
MHYIKPILGFFPNTNIGIIYFIVALHEMCVPPGEKMSANHAMKIAMKLSLHDASPVIAITRRH